MDEIINYTMENPTNTNPNVLRGMLENYGGNSSGYTVTETVIHENENAVFTSNHYDFTPSFNKWVSCYVSINGVTTDMLVEADKMISVPCGRYGVTLAVLENNGVRLTATPRAETVPSLTNASVKLFIKTVEVTDDFVFAVAKAIEIING